MFCLLNIVNVNITIDSCIPIESSDGIIKDMIEIELKLEAVEIRHFVLSFTFLVRFKILDQAYQLFFLCAYHKIL